ncbi:unnamed protein product [Hermetia illucens]|uniref:Uncharacterized protein n=1 Tax=Hermetia illucens TaxID=343691 RepID=A0A7R8YRE7_HERIL|nr:uncharacterized protein LOC119648757 [Hermetia illucens]CAD7082776.1 unnamed protein product [Hermetia illucens]
MAGPKTALYAAGLTCLGFICFALASTAVGVPIWGYYDNPTAGWDADRGYFGPWLVCKQLSYNREKCGQDVSRFRPSLGIYISGILAASSAAALGLFCILCVIQIAMISSREKFMMNYSTLVIGKLVLALIGMLLAIVATVLFAIFMDDTGRSGFRVSRGVSFYIQIIVVVLTIALFVMAGYDVLFSRRAGGDPTVPVDTSPSTATTYNNPGFRERRPKNGVSVTDASGKPYSGITNGSMASMSTTLTSVSNGSSADTVVRSPLRSSLKKPRPPREGLGIQNPGFSGSGHSPPMNRNGSVKKVRIQTHSTEV